MELKMPTPCTECGEIFELLDGRRNPRCGNVVICSDCADKADEEIERDDEIQALRAEIEDAEYTIKGAKGRLRELGIDPEAGQGRTSRAGGRPVESAGVGVPVAKITPNIIARQVPVWT